MYYQVDTLAVQEIVISCIYLPPYNMSALSTMKLRYQIHFNLYISKNMNNFTAGAVQAEEKSTPYK